ncbi:non-ribosomal peptide synthetase [Thioclava sp. FR2]|uniref:non-ribosomal peptide synthetase n=1 Tax=Thioclava sp. FR2 TaxID=3445780 RepID=UPI003EBA4DE8
MNTPLPFLGTPQIGTRQECLLTPVQLGMIYESTLAHLPWVNLEQVVVEMDNELLSPTDLESAWAAVAKLHEALRLSILWRKRDAPVQVLNNSIDIDLSYDDWSHMSARKQSVTLDQWLASDREQGVDLEASPPWRVKLIKRGEKSCVMVWTIHHAFIDGRSMAIVLEDLFDILEGRPAKSELAPSNGFSVFCHTINDRETTEAETYFRSILTGFDQPNSISAAAAPPDGRAPLRKNQTARKLDATLSDALREQADTAGASLADLLHAAWGLVVARWTGRDESVIGVTRSGRYIAPNCTRTVGCLINTLPLRIQLEADKLAIELLSEMRRASLAIRPHEHASLTDIRRWAGLPGSVPLFETMVMFERASLSEFMRQLGPAWQHRQVQLHEEGALPITLAIYGDPQIQLVLEHDPGGVPVACAEAMLTHLVELLASFAKARSTAPLQQLTMLPRSEEASLLSLGRPNRRLPKQAKAISDLLSDSISLHHDAQALSMMGTDEILTYGQLGERVRNLAAALVSQGAGPGKIVAICLERSPQFIVALLAVIKSGAAFLPIDPSYPRDVINHALTDSAAVLVIAEPQMQLSDTLRVVPPTASAPFDDQTFPVRIYDPEQLAYVIYTSGSTGVPKGVRVPMRALVSHAAAIGAEFDLHPSDRVLQFASLSFDVSIEEIIPTLLAGAKLILRDKGMADSVAGFLESVARKDLTVLNLPTAFWHVVVDEMARTGLRLPPSVRLVIVGGEQISPRALADWQKFAPDVRWLNGYGPTETAITCTLHEPGKVHPGSDIPIGRPTAHACAYVLAADGTLAPKGTVGDLWIGGPAVSSGYIGRAEETASAFKPDMFSGHGQMYRTGDRARWLADDTLAYLGRQDRQVKLRGFRIDLRHVEQALEQEDCVDRALAMVLGRGTPEARLAAWVKLAEGKAVSSASELQGSVASRLPPHMVPAIVVLSDFPRTPGGKIDTAALPQPAPEPHMKRATAPQPADATTQLVADLMAASLGLDSIDPDDRFHDLGGHSLTAVRLIGQIENKLGHRLSVGDLHRNPTPRTLAATISAAQTGPRYIIPIQPKGSRPPLFGVHVLGRNEEHFRPLAAELGPDQPVYGLSVGPPTQDTPVGVEATAKCYFDDIQRHFPTGPINLAAVSLASYFAFELAQQLRAAGRKVTMIALFDAEGPGGRSRLHGVARVNRHLAHLRQEGVGYLLRLGAHKLSDWRHKLEERNLSESQLATVAEDAPDAVAIGAFIAANVHAVEQYDVQSIDVPLTIFRAEENRFDSPEIALDGLGWAPVAEAGFEVIDNPGGHLTMLQHPYVVPLARRLARSMARDR